MIFHEQLFKDKGWGPNQGYLKVTAISVIRSDKITNVHYCKSFYQGLVLILNKLNLKRSSESSDLDETGCSMVQDRPENEMVKQFNNKVQLSNNPFFFYGEKTPVAEHSLKEFVSHLSLKHSISDYVIALFDRETKDTFFTVKSKGKKDTHFKLNHQSLNTLEEM